MKKILCAGLGMFSMLNITSAFAMDIRPFIGLNIAANAASWQDEADAAAKNLGVDLPTGFYGLGLDAGVVFANDNIYNAGVALSYDYAFDSNADLSVAGKLNFHSVKAGFSALSATFDNYIRVSNSESKRKDIVIGVGIARMEERMEIKPTVLIGWPDIKDKYHENVFVFKFGYNQQLETNLDWYINTRWFFTHKASDWNSMLGVNTGLRYVF